MDEWLRQVWGERYHLVIKAINTYPASGFYESPEVKANRLYQIIKFLKN